jgi:hypothetical protein
LATLRRKWAFFVLKHSHPRLWLHFCLLLTATLIILQFTKYARVHFLLVMLVATLMAYERLAFAELFAEQKIRIDALEDAKTPDEARAN